MCAPRCTRSGSTPRRRFAGADLPIHMPSLTQPMDRANQIARSATLLAGLSGAALFLTILWQLSLASIFGPPSALAAFWIALAAPRAVADSFHYGILTFLFIAIFSFPDDAAD